MLIGVPIVSGSSRLIFLLPWLYFSISLFLTVSPPRVQASPFHKAGPFQRIFNLLSVEDFQDDNSKEIDGQEKDNMRNENLDLAMVDLKRSRFPRHSSSYFHPRDPPPRSSPPPSKAVHLFSVSRANLGPRPNQREREMENSSRLPTLSFLWMDEEMRDDINEEKKSQFVKIEKSINQMMEDVQKSQLMEACSEDITVYCGDTMLEEIETEMEINKEAINDKKEEENEKELKKEVKIIKETTLDDKRNSQTKEKEGPINDKGDTDETFGSSSSSSSIVQNQLYEASTSNEMTSQIRHMKEVSTVLDIMQCLQDYEHVLNQQCYHSLQTVLLQKQLERQVHDELEYSLAQQSYKFFQNNLEQFEKFLTATSTDAFDRKLSASMITEIDEIEEEKVNNKEGKKNIDSKSHPPHSYSHSPHDHKRKHSQGHQRPPSHQYHQHNQLHQYHQYPQHQPDYEHQDQEIEESDSKEKEKMKKEVSMHKYDGSIEPSLNHFDDEEGYYYDDDEYYLYHEVTKTEYILYFATYIFFLLVLLVYMIYEGRKHHTMKRIWKVLSDNERLRSQMEEKIKLQIPVMPRKKHLCVKLLVFLFFLLLLLSIFEYFLTPIYNLTTSNSIMVILGILLLLVCILYQNYKTQWGLPLPPRTISVSVSSLSQNASSNAIIVSGPPESRFQPQQGGQVGQQIIQRVRQQVEEEEQETQITVALEQFDRQNNNDKNESFSTLSSKNFNGQMQMQLQQGQQGGNINMHINRRNSNDSDASDDDRPLNQNQASSSNSSTSPSANHGGYSLQISNSHSHSAQSSYI